jgi:phage-related protein
MQRSSKPSTLIKGLALPILGVVAAVAALVGWFVYLYNTNEDFREAAQALFERLTPLWESFKESVKAVAQSFIDAWNDIKQPLVDLYDFIVDSVIMVIRKMGSDEEGGIGFLKDKFIYNWQLIFGVVSGVISGIVALIGGLLVAIINGVTQVLYGVRTIATGIYRALSGAFEFLWNLISGIFKLIGALFSGDTERIKQVWNDFTQSLGESIAKAFNGIGNVITGVMGVILGFMVAIINAVIAVGNALLEVVKGFARFWNSTIGAMSFDLPKWLGGGTFSMPRFNDSFMNYRIPYVNEKVNPTVALAKGGIVPAMNGGMLALIGEGGARERVEPLDPSGLSKRDRAMISMLAQQSGMGATIHVHPSPGMDERELANLVSRRLAYEMRTGAA